MTIDYTDTGIESRLTFTISRDGYLRYHQILNLTAEPEYGIPANTPTYEAEFAEPKIAGSLD
ncbi:MAG TPA: hypothetical protein VE569_03400 [Acidimicrobiia bacterium]|nr:hypothetical protein [Acidimicrobiia bacterium]